MARSIDIVGLQISSNLFPCRNKCRYCLLGGKTRDRIAADRFLDIVERFIAWSEAARKPLRILHGMEYSSEIPVDALKRQLDLQGRAGWADETRGIRLGGLAWRSDDDLRAWLRERRDVAGIRKVHASLAGLDGQHDHWHGRHGDFDRLYRTMAIAAELGLALAQRLFLIRDTLPVLEALLDRLDVIDRHAHRYLCLFYYRGHGSRLEDQRITEEIRDRLPARLAALDRRYGQGWRSEREWIEHLAHQPETPRPVHLKLAVTEANIERIAGASCDEIFDELSGKTGEAYAALPSREELCRKAGDATDRHIYMSFDDLEKKWLDVYARQCGRPVDPWLTHLAADS